MMKKILSFTGPSGAGKTSIARELIRQNPQITMVKSITTRAKRESDLPGEYAYVSKEEFNALSSRGELLWTAEYSGTSYGTTKESIEEIIFGKGRIGIMILVPSVLETLTSFLKSHDALAMYAPIFLLPPTEEELRRRLRARGDEEKDIERRIKEASNWEDDARKGKFPFTFVENSSSLKDSVEKVESLLTC